MSIEQFPPSHDRRGQPQPGRHTGPAPSRTALATRLQHLALALVVLAHASCSSPAWSGATRCTSRPQAASSDVALHPPEHKPPRRLHRALSFEPPKLPLPNLPQPLEPPPVEIIKVEAPPAPLPPPWWPWRHPRPRLRHRRHRHWCRRRRCRQTASPARLFEEYADTPDRAMVAEVLQPARRRQLAGRHAQPQTRETVCLSQLNISPRDFREGFPGMDRIEWFGLDIRFTVDMPQDMTRDILLLSDDGSSLSIDGVEVLNNDGIHAPAAVKASVKAHQRPHAFRVRYFQGQAPASPSC